MTRKRKEFPILENITITDVAAEGKALARVDDMVVFVPFVVPGDVVDLKIQKKKHHYCEATAVKFHQYSPFRAVPFCPHFGVCGGVSHIKSNLNTSNSKFWITLPASVR